MLKHEFGDLTDGRRRLTTLFLDGKLLILEVGEVGGMLEVDLSSPQDLRALEEFAESLLSAVWFVQDQEASGR
jgi:hypothetical protein